MGGVHFKTRAPGSAYNFFEKKNEGEKGMNKIIPNTTSTAVVYMQAL